MLADKVESWTEQWKRQGLEEGSWKDWQEGWQEGFQEGLIQGEVRLLRHLLEYRYGQLPDWVPAKLRQATEKQLFNWGKRMFDASTLAGSWNKKVAARNDNNGPVPRASG